MILVDTGAWYASVVPTDPDHAAAVAWLDGNHELLLTTDYIVDETLTLLLARGQKSRAISFGTALMKGQLAKIHFIQPAEFEEAWIVFRSYLDKEWSFTDCTSKIVLTKLAITTAFSFDQHFRQFGNATVVPSEAGE
jgi:predicted nucleic acid-binding protein